MNSWRCFSFSALFCFICSVSSTVLFQNLLMSLFRTLVVIPVCPTSAVSKRWCRIFNRPVTVRAIDPASSAYVRWCYSIYRGHVQISMSFSGTMFASDKRWRGEISHRCRISLHSSLLNLRSIGCSDKLRLRSFSLDRNGRNRWRNSSQNQ